MLRRNVYGLAVIPIRDENPTRRRTYLTYLLIALNVAVWLLIQPQSNREAVIPLPNERTPLARELARLPDLRFTLAHAAVPCEVAHRRPLTVDEVVATNSRQGNANACGIRLADNAALGRQPAFPDKLVWLSVVLSMFLHGGLLHLAGNMLFLFIFGNNIEDRWGSAKFLVFYLASGLVATIGHVVAQTSSTVPVVGASGAIAGVMGAYLVLYPNARVTTVFTVFLFYVRKVRAAWILAIWFISQFFLTSGSGVAWVAHVVGFVFGAAVAFVANGWHAGERVGAG